MALQLIVDQSTVRKVCQLTGEWDRELGPDKRAFNKTLSRFGLNGTDLGYSFEHDGRLWFLFGDTWPMPLSPTAELGAVSRDPKHMEVFAVGEDGVIRRNWFWDDRWKGWDVLDGARFSQTARLAAVSRDPKHMEVFAVGEDRRMRGNWFWDDGWKGWYTLESCSDSVAWTDSTAPEPGILLEFVNDNSVYRSPQLVGPAGEALTTRCLEVPIAGFSAAGQMYVFHSTGAFQEGGKDVMERTVLALAEGGDPTNLHALYEMSNVRSGGHFINVACAIVSGGLPHLPFTGPALLAWGSGRYRESDVYLAAVPLADVAHRSAWWFYSATPTPWDRDERKAKELFDHRQVGELSVSWIASLNAWLMLYNAKDPRGIVGRVAPSPWGPWSDPVLVFDPRWPGVGYGHFMHDPHSPDRVSDPGREHEYGGEYGPYLIGRYTVPMSSGTVGPRAQVYFVMSTWNPYNTMLMTAVLEVTT